jgi:hypothetical protein
MYETKNKIILKILAQRSPKLELWLKRYGKKSFGDLFRISGKLLGLYVEIFMDSRGAVCRIGGLRDDLE